MCRMVFLIPCIYECSMPYLRTETWSHGRCFIIRQRWFWILTQPLTSSSVKITSLSFSFLIYKIREKKIQFLGLKRFDEIMSKSPGYMLIFLIPTSLPWEQRDDSNRYYHTLTIKTITTLLEKTTLNKQNRRPNWCEVGNNQHRDSKGIKRVTR